MSHVKYRYFKVIESEFAKLDQIIREKQEACRKAEDELATKYGAEDVVTVGRGLRGGREIVGLHFENEDGPHDGFRRKDENGLTFYVPNKRSKRGKEAAFEFKHFEVFSVDSFIIEHFDAYRAVFEGNTYAWSTAGYSRDLKNIVVIVPVYSKVKEPPPGEVVYRRKDHESFEPPDTLIEIKKSEFVALTEE